MSDLSYRYENKANKAYLNPCRPVNFMTIEEVIEICRDAESYEIYLVINDGLPYYQEPNINV